MKFLFSFADLRHELLDTISDSAIPAVANVDEVDAVIGSVEKSFLGNVEKNFLENVQQTFLGNVNEKTSQPILNLPFSENFVVEEKIDEVLLSDSDESP